MYMYMYIHVQCTHTCTCIHVHVGMCSMCGGVCMTVYVSECVCVCQCERVWTLGVWGELACHKRSSTHRPSSQGWAPCVLLFGCLFVCLFHGMGGCWVSFSSFLSVLLVCYIYTYNSMYTCTCIYIYMYMYIK